MAAYGKGADLVRDMGIKADGVWSHNLFACVTGDSLSLQWMVVLPGISDQRFVTNGIGRRFYVPIRNLRAFQPRSQPTGKPSQSVSPAGGKSLVQDLQSELPSSFSQFSRI